MSADLSTKPAAGSSESVKAGNQRSKLRHDLGNGVGFLAVIVAVVVGMATNFGTGIIVALVGIGIGIWIAYGS